MKVKIPGKEAKETLQICIEAARVAGHFRLDNDRTEGRYALFVLRMDRGVLYDARKRRRIEDRGTAEERQAMFADLRYRKRGFSHMAHGRGREYGNAVCFHGFRAFMREIYRNHPDAVIRTAKAAYLGSEDFEEKWPSVGAVNVGSQFCPISYAEACDC